MKRRKLIKEIEKHGWYFKRHGGNHDVYTNGDIVEHIGRHPDIPEQLAKKIIRTARNNPIKK